MSAAAEPKRKRTSVKQPAAASHKHTKSKTAPEAVPAVPAETSDSPAPRVVTYEDIALLAYSYWEARGYQGGTPEEDWLRAERELAILT